MPNASNSDARKAAERDAAGTCADERDTEQPRACNCTGACRPVEQGGQGRCSTSPGGLPAALQQPPCHGKHDLFESTLPVDHSEARAICADCPMIDACRELLREELWRGNPSGTWAGELVFSVRGTSRIAAPVEGFPGKPPPVDMARPFRPPCEACFGQTIEGQTWRGMCARCYKIDYRARRRGVSFSEVQTVDSRRELHAHAADLIAQGWSREAAAREVGMKPGSLYQALRRMEQREQVAS